MRLYFLFTTLNIWKQINRPIVGLAPMDGVTDVVFRQIIDRHSKPSVLYTEFVPVEAIKAGAYRVLQAFMQHKTDTPTIAQLYGTDLEAYYLSTLVVCELGFDGVDINMGCPAKSVESRGAGAGLIKNPNLALKIIQTVRKATNDYLNGSYKSTLIKGTIRNKVSEIRRIDKKIDMSPIPVSLKTRTGIEKDEVDMWISIIASAMPDCITLHGRTLRQMYRGRSDWDAIKRANQIVKNINPEICFLGNGDIESYSDALSYSKAYGIDGVLVGHATLGNPFFFNESEVHKSKEVIIDLMIEHGKLYEETYANGHFLSLRKHMLWYSNLNPELKEMKKELQTINSLTDLKDVLSKAG